MELIAGCSAVFSFLRDIYDAFPSAIKLLVCMSFSGVVYISVMRNIGR